MKSNRTIEHYVAPLEETPLAETDSAVSDDAPRSLWADAWASLRRNPLFLISAVLILLVLVVSFFPQLFTQVDPRSCELSRSLRGPGGESVLGYNFQGCDIYSRVIYGTQASVSVGIFATLGVVLFGGMMGALAGYYGGWVDSLIARLIDIVFALPLVLGALVVMQREEFQANRGVWTVVLVLVLFGWPQTARITRAAVIEAKSSDYVVAARALGVSRFGALVRHVIPNAVAPVIVIATVSLGIFIVAEATLSYLGIGLPSSIMSWGNDISAAQASIRTDPQVLIYPAIALSVTVLSFIMLGDAVRDALDPKARKR
ncbi:ABC transporter permease [Acaricomes phytoseiuli]|uniref:ABC transporter permease n=1 Tax=Acaricomes phytoseiuli TaxID=291968 RepID=UPI0003A57AA1|nr:ABC transporter permease [Acaricomes phytoseiuli]MCW1249782.1 ABC transporter permease [Acaricomes phytoseiuli]